MVKAKRFLKTKIGKKNKDNVISRGFCKMENVLSNGKCFIQKNLAHLLLSLASKMLFHEVLLEEKIKSNVVFVKWKMFHSEKVN